jgi:hypothetical protein
MSGIGDQRHRAGDKAADEFHEHEQRGQDNGDPQSAFIGRVVSMRVMVIGAGMIVIGLVMTAARAVLKMPVSVPLIVLVRSWAGFDHDSINLPEWVAPRNGRTIEGTTVSQPRSLAIGRSIVPRKRPGN